MGRRSRLVAFAVVGVLAFAAALWVARPRPSKEAVAPPTSTRWPTASPEAESYDFAGDLNLLLIKPDGAVLDSTRPHGAVSLEQAATWFAHPTDGALTLRRNEYLRGATGTWQLPGGEVVEVRLEQFSHASDGSIFWYWALKEELEVDPDVDGEAVGDGMEFNQWYRFKPDSSGRYLVREVFFQADIGGEVLVWTTGAANPELAVSLARQQYGVLPPLR